MVGSCASNCEYYSNLDIGTITFQMLSSGVNTFTAYITKIKVDMTTMEQLYMFAGKDILVISDVGRRLMPHVPKPGVLAEDRAPMRLPGRRLADCGGNSSIPGDTNADCVFDVEDVEFMQFYIVGIVTDAELTDAQRSAMDTDLSGAIDGVDIGYLMKVVALSIILSWPLIRLALLERCSLQPISVSVTGHRRQRRRGLPLKLAWLIMLRWSLERV